MSWNKERRWVWGYFMFIITYILLHSICEVCSLRQQIELNKESIELNTKNLGKQADVIFEKEAAFREMQKDVENYHSHVHRYSDGHIKRR